MHLEPMNRRFDSSKKKTAKYKQTKSRQGAKKKTKNDYFLHVQLYTSIKALSQSLPSVKWGKLYRECLRSRIVQVRLDSVSFSALDCNISQFYFLHIFCFTTDRTNFAYCFNTQGVFSDIQSLCKKKTQWTRFYKAYENSLNILLSNNHRYFNHSVKLTTRLAWIVSNLVDKFCWQLTSRKRKPYWDRTLRRRLKYDHNKY